MEKSPQDLNYRVTGNWEMFIAGKIVSPMDEHTNCFFNTKCSTLKTSNIIWTE